MPALVAATAVPVVLAGTASAAPAEDLFFSEYVEGSSNNKALEIYNGTTAAVDLGAQGYSVRQYSNGSSSAGPAIGLTGTVQPGDVVVLAHASAAQAILDRADLTTGAGLFNGDDAVVLVRGETVLDVVGQIGSDPGTQWGTGETSTADKTLRRLPSVCAGDTDGTDAFDPATEWQGFATDTFDGLGSHTSDCTAGPAAPVINEFSASTAGTDVEYVEIHAAPGADLSGSTVLGIEGDRAGTATGTVDNAIELGQAGADGLYLADLAASTLENGTLTLLLVEGFTGGVGDDLDTDDDGTLDAAPWTSVVDAVAVHDGGTTDLTYGTPVLGTGYDGMAFAPGAASRIPDGRDTGTAADWVRNDFDLAGIEGQTGTPVDGEALNTPGTPNEVWTAPPPVCGDPEGVALVSEIQGSGATFDPTCAGTQTVEAVVTAVHPGLNGFYAQEEPADSDGDPATSEGIFVFGPTPAGLEIGDAVRVTGTVGEYATSGSSQTQLSGAAVVNLGDATPIAPTAVTFPVASPDALEAYEGMLVQLTDTLVISEYFNYDRFGEVVLAKPLDGTGRLYTPTAVAEPGPEAQALLAEYERRVITLDDAVSASNPATVPHPGNGEPFSATNTFRGGDTVTGVTGVVDNTFGLYRIQPTVYGEYAAVNPRPEKAPAVGGTLHVASFNVLNYFLTLDEGQAVCGPELDQDCRGANSAAELERQRTKILDALAELDADLVGLMEMENTTGVEPAADLVAGLNNLLGAGTYAYVDTGVIGTDAIRLGMLYKPGAVQPVGDFAVLDSSDDPRFDDSRNRPMLTQTFTEVATGEVLTVSVNHLKSKGSACGAADPDTGDGQGNCNLTRTAAAEAIVDYLAGDPTGSGDPDHLVIGDLNSYDHEDPIDVFVREGYTDLIKKFGGELAYGYVFDGMAGYLDHALSNETLTGQVTGAQEWHINADEPDILDYNLDFGRPADYWTGEEYRSSDHDAVLVGLDLDSPDTTPPTLTVELSHASLWPANHRYVDVTASVTAADDRPGVTWELVSVTSDEPDNGDDDGNTVDDVVIVDETHVRLRAERSGTGDGRVYTFTYRASDAAGNTAEATATVEVPLSRGS